MTADRTRTRQVVRCALGGLAAAHVVEALILRRRRKRLVPLPDAASAPQSGAGSSGVAGAAVVDAGGADLAKVAVVSLPGVRVDGPTLAAVRAEMEASAADVVDLVPGDLPVERALRMLRRIDPEQVETNPMDVRGGVHEVLVVSRALTERMGAGDHAETGNGGGLADRGVLVRQTGRAHQYAPTSAMVRVAPGLRSPPWSPLDRWRELVEQTAWAKPYAALAPCAVALETVHLMAMTAGLLVAPPAALGALATWSVQPAIVFGLRTKPPGEPGSPGSLQPPGLVGESVLRLPLAWLRNLRTALVGYRETRAAAVKRAAEPWPVAPPSEELFEQPGESCPWCESSSLVGRLDTTDLWQHKPGRFHLDECRDCGHIFQNPLLSIAGLDYYYADFFEGAGQDAAEVVFTSMGPGYQNRIEAMAQVTEPRAWLDVGTGYGHFCLAARRRWPDATFDGLDMSDSVEEGQRRRWIDTAHRGMFLDLADDLPRPYDVVSMHHYLEHTREPRAELAAAARVLDPGGHLLIEVPDAASPWARRLGRWWHEWGQPWHLHFLRCENLVAALEDQGLEVVWLERGPATLGGDLATAVILATESLARSPHLPWLPRPPVAHRAKRLALFGLAAPVVALAAAADRIKDARLARDDVTNAYRLIARKAL